MKITAGKCNEKGTKIMAENLTMQEYIDEAESELLHTYNRYQIVLDKGDGVYLYD